MTDVGLRVARVAGPDSSDRATGTSSRSAINGFYRRGGVPGPLRPAAGRGLRHGLRVPRSAPDDRRSCAGAKEAHGGLRLVPGRQRSSAASLRRPHRRLLRRPALRPGQPEPGGRVHALLPAVAARDARSPSTHHPTEDRAEDLMQAIGRGADALPESASATRRTRSSRAADWPYPAHTRLQPRGDPPAATGRPCCCAGWRTAAGISHLCAARSANGVDGWVIDPQPTLARTREAPRGSIWGVEDPRITYVAELEQVRGRLHRLLAARPRRLPGA